MMSFCFGLLGCLILISFMRIAGAPWIMIYIACFLWGLISKFVFDKIFK